MDGLRQAKREKEMFVVGGAGMKEMVKRVMDKDTLTPVDIIYSPSMIAVAIELTAIHFVAKLPVNGNYILDSPLITPENATQYYFPSSHSNWKRSAHDGRNLRNLRATNW
jgi:ribose transport system substrate-binding protein